MCWWCVTTGVGGGKVLVVVFVVVFVVAVVVGICNDGGSSNSCSKFANILLRSCGKWPTTNDSKDLLLLVLAAVTLVVVIQNQLNKLFSARVCVCAFGTS